jgi:hypothetical protein
MELKAVHLTCLPILGDFGAEPLTPNPMGVWISSRRTCPRQEGTPAGLHTQLSRPAPPFLLAAVGAG